MLKLLPRRPSPPLPILRFDDALLNYIFSFLDIQPLGRLARSCKRLAVLTRPISQLRVLGADRFAIELIDATTKTTVERIAVESRPFRNATRIRVPTLESYGVVQARKFFNIFLPFLIVVAAVLFIISLALGGSLCFETEILHGKFRDECFRGKCVTTQDTRTRLVKPDLFLKIILPFAIILAICVAAWVFQGLTWALVEHFMISYYQRSTVEIPKEIKFVEKRIFCHVP